MRITAVLVATSLLGACIADSTDSSDQDLVGQPEPQMLGQHSPRGYGKPGGSGGGSPDLLWHSGDIMSTGAVVTPIFWGRSWLTASFVQDKITGLAAFYTGISGTPYMNTNTEYTGTSGQVSAVVTYTGNVVDASAAPTHAPQTSAVLAEVCAKIANPVANGYYPVYVDLPRGHAGYCAWHSYGTCNGVPVQFGFFFNLDGDPGCDPSDTWTTNSQGLAALASVSGHELSETVTDPRNGGWWDSSGAENADKCAWTFNKPVQFKDASGNVLSTWKIQGNWSNAAYDNGQTGYTKGGCIDGN